MTDIAVTLRSTLVILSLASCSNDRATAPLLLPETVAVSPGLTPSFSWGPGGAVYSITVTRLDSGQILWSAVGQLHSNAIEPSVVYGSTPPGAIATANPVFPLTTGHQYRVALARIAPDSSVEVVGQAGFNR